MARLFRAAADDIPALASWRMGDLAPHSALVERRREDFIPLWARDEIAAFQARERQDRPHRDITLETLTFEDVTVVFGGLGFVLFRGGVLSDHNAGLPNFTPDAVTVQERFDDGFLAGDLYGDNNISHGLFDVLGRALLARRILDFDESRIFASEAPGDYLNFVRAQALPGMRSLPRNTAFGFRRLTLFRASVSPNDHPANHAHPLAVSLIRAALGCSEAANDGTGPLLYLSRRDAARRRLVNEAELVEHLQGEGFEAVEMGTLSAREQIGLAAQASAIVGPHGAALTNIVFCRPGTPVVELFNPERGTTAYYKIAERTGLGYRCVFGAPTGERQDWRIDAGAVAAAARDALAALRGQRGISAQ